MAGYSPSSSVTRRVHILSWLMAKAVLRSSPWFSDQAEMFAKGEMKKVAFTEKDVDREAVVKYRPGDRRQ